MIFFPFDSLGAVPENPGTVIRGVRLPVGPICRGTTVLDGSQICLRGTRHRHTDFSKPLAGLIKPFY